MICTECGREHGHAPGDYLVVTVSHHLRGYMAKVGGRIVFSKRRDCEVLGNKVHRVAPRKNFHWHWPGDVKPVLQEAA